ncbi:MAG: D-aminoacyl-tRNA deacylase [Anaerofustis sp.]
MRAVIQRVSASSVMAENQIVGAIGRGLNVLIGFGIGDTETDIEYIAEKLCGLRIFEDAEGKMNLSVRDIGGEMLIISQFTLYGDVRKGKRPSFSSAIAYSEGERLYALFVERIKSEHIPTQTGIYGADMKVTIENDGPVTILLDSEKKF